MWGDLRLLGEDMLWRLNMGDSGDLEGKCCGLWRMLVLLWMCWSWWLWVFLSMVSFFLWWVICFLVFVWVWMICFLSVWRWFCMLVMCLVFSFCLVLLWVMVVVKWECRVVLILSWECICWVSFFIWWVDFCSWLVRFCFMVNCCFFEVCIFLSWVLKEFVFEWVFLCFDMVVESDCFSFWIVSCIFLFELVDFFSCLIFFNVLVYVFCRFLYVFLREVDVIGVICFLWLLLVWSRDFGIKMLFFFSKIWSVVIFFLVWLRFILSLFSFFFICYFCLIVFFVWWCSILIFLWRFEMFFL